MSSNGKSSNGKGKTKPKGGKSDAGGKKVFTVNHYSGFQTEEPWDEHQEFPPHSVLVVFSTTDKIPLVSNMEHSAHHMILDTACQRSCCGMSWYQHPDRLLKNLETENGIVLPTFLHHQRELFQFGAGDPQVSSKLAHFPMGVQEQCCYLGASILEAGIPFLGSLSMITWRLQSCPLDAVHGFDNVTMPFADNSVVCMRTWQEMYMPCHVHVGEVVPNALFKR